MKGIYKLSATGAAAIAATTKTTATGKYRLLSVTLNLSAAGTTSEAFSITYDANDGAAYDTLLYTNDLSVGAVTDLVWFPDGDFVLEDGDAIAVAWPNTETRTYGLQVTLEIL